MTRRHLCFLLLVLTVAAGAVGQTQERPKPNFTGTWKFNPQKSVLQLPRVPDSVVGNIKHQEPTIEFARTMVFGERSDTFAITLTTDGKVAVRNNGNAVNRLRAYWLGDSLIFEAIVDSEGDWATNYVSYTLSEDGKVMTAVERFRSRQRNYDNQWVLEKE